MGNKPLFIKKEQGHQKTLYVPESLFKKWVEHHTFPNKISLGAKTVSCQVAPHYDKKNEYLVSEDLWEELMIPYDGPVHLFEHEQVVYLGPLVGIFTAGFTNNLIRPIGDRSLLFAKLLSTDRKVGAFYFIFGANHIDWENGTINGYFYKKDGWKQIVVPFPNVVYDRLPNRRTEKLQASKNVRERLQNDYLIPWFNPSFFDKWEINQKLVSDQVTEHLLPKNYLNPTQQQVEELLDEYNHVYFKPAKGSLGIGIQQVIKLNDDPFYYCRFREKGQNRLRRYSSLKRLLHQQFPNGFKNMIAQQGIHLIRWQNNPIDFRLHTNKDENGKWQVSALAAKIAGPGSVTTHVKSGGEVKTVHEIFKETGTHSNLLTKLKEAALLLSERIDHTMEGFVGEIGFDLGIDKSGEIWMFEANSKPGRTIFYHPKLKHDDLLSRRLPLAYAVYLFKQSITQPGRIYSS
ncbi:YheC/YheD family protein [Anaerobacillus sp. MEB173]|uniref:YheC/YheD family endospore coat-associated protein n=1 Tax=Anaerobacillus sp. MEB173 TaxID=3383345 RepID=UPI003F8F514A